ncbi:hypothetical protein [Burkholderia vietnamiensis]|uniref:hypothetical protein n=1 Tax=Burkholderia vietnamiensis TaxID=60552 RepID=UPI002019B0DF|nr:hypothetical protein [Burkholderia vietnamiensis]MCO1348067.1 hypothetical protein [Burkholderia vietnamiensis]UQN46421.1 hypothetical protein L0Y95_13590 [Burkholderia vietnamiensis]
MGQKILGWLSERGLTVASIWFLVSQSVWIAVTYFGAGSGNAKTGEPSIFSAEGIAAVADKKLLGYLGAGWLLFLVAGGVSQLLIKMKAGEQQRLRAFGNHILDELSSASTHAAFAYLFSIVVVAHRSLEAKEAWTIIAFCLGGIIGFNVNDEQQEPEQEQKDHVPAAGLGLKIDRLVDDSIVAEVQTVTGSLSTLPSPGYHLWAIRDWEELYSRGEFYPEVELTLESRNKSWKAGAVDGEKTHIWKAPNFYFGGEPGHQRAFEIIMVDDADHERLIKSRALAKSWSTLRDKAQEKFNVYPTPTMRWDQIRAERCIRIIVQREKAPFGATP